MDAGVAVTVDNAVMTVRGGRRWSVVRGLLIVGVVVFALGRFLAGQHLAKADQWASVISMFLTAAGLAVAVYGVVQDRRSASSRTAERPVETVRNTITDAEVAGPALLVRDAQRVSLTGTPIPAPADPDRQGEQVPPEGRTPGDVENRVEGGTFHGPLIMGRDLHDVTLPAPSRPDGQGGNGTVR
jgi:hypothetical protein